MRVLILSCNTGEGHNSCAKAIKEVYDKNGDICDITDALKFISDKTSRFISWGHVFVYRNLSWLFNFGYVFTERHTGTFQSNSMMYNFFSRGSQALYESIIEGKYEAVICVHPFASLMLTETKRRYHLPIKTAFVATDYTCSPSVKDSKLDYYFIPDESLISEFESTNIPKEKIVASGIPICQMFYEASKVIPNSKQHIVMMCGSMGCGPIDKLTDLLTVENNDIELTVICGTNKKLNARLQKRYGNRQNLHICGYVKDMPGMLDSADLYLTKPGGISVTEAVIRNKPMAFINAVAGCEAYNREFFVRRGVAFYGKDTEQLASMCRKMLLDDRDYNNLVVAFDSIKKKNAAEIIYQTISIGGGENKC